MTAVLDVMPCILVDRWQQRNMCLYLEAAHPLLASSCQTAWLHISQDCNLNVFCCEYLRSFSILNVFILFILFQWIMVRYLKLQAPNLYVE